MDDYAEARRRYHDGTTNGLKELRPVSPEAIARVVAAAELRADEELLARLEAASAERERVVAAAREYVAAEIAWEQHFGLGWVEYHVRLDHARMELRAACGFEGAE